MKKNTGFSLIEVLAVVAILGILMTGIGLFTVSRASWKTREAAEAITTALGETRTNTLAKTNGWMKLFYDSARKTYVLSTSYDFDQELGNKIQIYYKTDAGSTEYDLKTSDPLILSFSRGSGAFQGMISDIYTTTSANGKTLYTFAYKTREVDGVTKNISCTQIRIADGTSHEYVITLYPMTGRFDSERK